MKWKKPPPELTALFDAVAPTPPLAERRQMFGYPCCFVNGNMFAGLHQENMMLRLPDGQRKELLKVKGVRVFEPMPGRPMREYVAVPPSLLADHDALRGWMAKSLEYARSLPAKAKKAKTRRSGKAG